VIEVKEENGKINRVLFPVEVGSVAIPGSLSIIQHQKFSR
jgi:hypothetical protein